MAIARVQFKTNQSDAGDTSPTATLDAGPTQNNLVVAVVSASEAGGAGDVTFTAPSGYTLAAEGNDTAGGHVAIYYKVAGASESATVTATLSASRRWQIVLIEYSGTATSSVLDQVATNTAAGVAGVTADSGTTPTTASANQVWVAGLMNANIEAQTSPTNSFTAVANATNTTANNNRGRLYAYEKIVSAAATANVAATIGASRLWAGAIATFKEPPRQSLAYNPRGVARNVLLRR